MRTHDASTAYFGKDLEAMSFARNYHEWIFEEFAQYFGTKVAEVGAGTGNFSEIILRDSTRELFAFEPSVNMFPLLASKLASQCKATVVQSIFGTSEQCRPEFFDSIAYINVLEHIEDDVGEIAIAKAALKADGHLLIFVPAHQWLYSDLDKDVGHYRRYSRSDLIHKIHRSGLKLVKIKYFDSFGIVPWYLAFVLLKLRTSAGNVSAYDRLVVPILKAVEMRFAPPIGKNILLIARKL